MKTARMYDKQFKINAIKLAQTTSTAQAIKELGIPEATFYGWLKQAKEGRLDLSGTEVASPQISLSLAEENSALKLQIKQLQADKERLQEEKDILEAATVFFARSRKK